MFDTINFTGVRLILLKLSQIVPCLMMILLLNFIYPLFFFAIYRNLIAFACQSGIQ